MNLDTIKVFCPKCNEEYEVSRDNIGVKAECEACNEIFIIQDDFTAYDFDHLNIAKFYSCNRHEIAHVFNKRMCYENAVKELQGICHAVVFDDILDNKEIKMIAMWIIKNQDYIDKFPISEVYQQFMLPVKRNEITDEWKKNTLKLLKSISAGLDTVNDIFDNPDPLILKDKNIVITGTFKSGYKRSEIFAIIEEIDGIPTTSSRITKNTDILIVGEKGSQSWRFGNYGRKIEHAIELRKSIGTPLIIKESIFLKTLNISS